MVKYLGGGILLILGIWAIIQNYSQTGPTDTPSSGLDEKPFQLLELHFMGLIIQILKQPDIVDIDRSGIISGNEAFLLGIALSIDSLTAGIAVSLLGYSILKTALCIGAGQFMFMYCGLLGGKQLERTGILKQIAILPALILIFLGLSRFY
jgi:putative sporulation protein YtaF